MATFNNIKSTITVILLILTFIGAGAGFAIKVTNQLAALNQAKEDTADVILDIRQQLRDINNKLDQINMRNH